MNCTFSPCINTGVICADFYIRKGNAEIRSDGKEIPLYRAVIYSHEKNYHSCRDFCKAVLT